MCIPISALRRRWPRIVRPWPSCAPPYANACAGRRFATHHALPVNSKPRCAPCGSNGAKPPRDPRPVRLPALAAPEDVHAEEGFRIGLLEACPALQIGGVRIVGILGAI